MSDKKYCPPRKAIVPRVPKRGLVKIQRNPAPKSATTAKPSSN